MPQETLMPQAISGNLQRLEIFNQGAALVGSEQRADDPFAGAIVELMAGVTVAPNGSIKLETS
jgi:hypothetical protein